MQGKIVAASGGSYVVTANGINYNVFPKGLFRFQNKRVLVGDNVIFDDESFVVSFIEERRNELIRPKCANVDQIFVTMSVKEPDLSYELLYKFLTYINMNGIPANVILTKVDLLDDFANINLLKDDLEKLGIKVYLLSPQKEDVLQSIKDSLKGKVSVFMGQTGVGKSSLINMLDSSFERKIGSYSVSRGRGKHQTKEVILLPYENGFIGDTPGFSALDLGVFKEDLAQFFPGYNSLYTECHFSDCLHQNEKECKIKEEINIGHLSEDAYQIYLKLMDELPYKKERYK